MKKLNFCCGTDILEGWDNLDIEEKEGILSLDANYYPYNIENNTYDEIKVRQVLQLLERPDRCLKELHRISKNKAIIDITVSYGNNLGASNDLLTKHYFTDKTFDVWINQKHCQLNPKILFKILELRKVPTRVGKLFPEFVRKRLDLFISGMYSNVEIKLEVIK